MLTALLSWAIPVSAPDVPDTGGADHLQGITGEQRVGHGHVHRGGPAANQFLRGLGKGAPGAGDVIEQYHMAPGELQVRQGDLH